MKFLDTLRNIFFSKKYKNHSEAVIVACYYNPTNNPYRLKAFNEFYDSIKHLNHRIVECVIGDAKPELPHTEFITRVNTTSTLWHKEALLNNIVRALPSEFRYIMWLDADVLFTNRNWMVDAVSELQRNRIVQLFEYCVHLEKDQSKPDFNLHEAKDLMNCKPPIRNSRLWRSFAANYVTTVYSDDHNYDKHGHVGFAWGAQRRLLEDMPLYDKALVGGADHIIAHAAAGHMKHNCIKKSFTDDIDAINSWSLAFFNRTRGKLGFVKGDLYHIWHGALENRQYLKRIQDFTATAKEITKKDKNGLYVTDNDEYVKEYFNHREDTVTKPVKIVKNGTYGTKGYIPNDDEIQRRKRELQRQYPTHDDSFIESLLVGYLTDSTMMGTAVGGDILGAAIGDMLNNTDQINEHSQESGFDGGFGGGGFSGGGAGGEWQDNSQNDTQNENFS